MTTPACPSPAPRDLSRNAVQLVRHMQSLEPGVYVLTVVKSEAEPMQWDVLRVPQRGGPPPEGNSNVAAS